MGIDRHREGSELSQEDGIEKWSVREECGPDRGDIQDQSGRNRHRHPFGQGNPSMQRISIAKAACLLALPFVVASIAGSDARAGDHHDGYQVSGDPAVGYAVPIQRVYQYPGVIVFQPTTPTGYAVPIQRVYQFPAPLVFQPGPELPFHARPGSWYDQYGGPSFIPR
jgi:hypothetical protein